MELLIILNEHYPMCFDKYEQLRDGGSTSYVVFSGGVAEAPPPAQAIRPVSIAIQSAATNAILKNAFINASLKLSYIRYEFYARWMYIRAFHSRRGLPKENRGSI